MPVQAQCVGRCAAFVDTCALSDGEPWLLCCVVVLYALLGETMYVCVWTFGHLLDSGWACEMIGDSWFCVVRVEIQCKR
jgi:hypothetical protein